MRKLFLYSSIFLFFMNSIPIQVLACDSCGCSLARIDSERKLSETVKSKPVFFDFTFEQQVWHKRDVSLANNLHEAGHDAHDKTHEEFYHFGIGSNLFKRFSIFAQMPYIVRHSLEIEDAGHLGERQRSEGFGDLNLTGILKLFKRKNDFIGPVAGIKFPTGKTTEKNKHGVKFEPELQPGSGSFDTTLGAVFQYELWPILFHGNALYAIRTKGAQEFRFGNLFSSYVYADYTLNPKNKYFLTKIGLNMTLQNEQKQKDHGARVKDSGGTTFLLGPEFSIQGNEYVSIFGNFLFPAIQNLGGVHQLVQVVWNAGVKIIF